MWRRSLMFLLAVAVLLCETGCEKAQPPGPDPATQFSPFAFDFSVTDVTGKSISLSDLQGKVVIVDIWGTWCPPCRMEVPSFVKLQQTYGSQGLQIIGINYEEPSDPEEVQRQAVVDLIEELDINYPCALGTESIQAQIPFFEGYPTTIFIDRTGKVRSKVVGMHSYRELEAKVRELLVE